MKAVLNNTYITVGNRKLYATLKQVLETEFQQQKQKLNKDNFKVNQICVLAIKVKFSIQYKS